MGIRMPVGQSPDERQRFEVAKKNFKKLQCWFVLLEESQLSTFVKEFTTCELKVVSQCNQCQKHFTVNDDKTQKEVNDQDINKLHEEQKEKEIDPQKEKKSSFTCNNCVTGRWKGEITKGERCNKTEKAAENKLYLTINKTVKIIIKQTERITIIDQKSIIGLLVILVAIMLYCYKSDSPEPFAFNMPDRTVGEKIFDDELDRLEELYGQQGDDVWVTFAAGVKSVLRETPNQPSVFLMLFDNDEAGKTAKCLALDVSKPATKYLLNVPKHPVLFSDHLNDKDIKAEPDKLLIELKEPIENKGAMIVTDLQDIPHKIAEKLHFICDKYTPFVNKALYFITLKVDKIVNKNLQKTAEVRMENLWESVMPPNVLHPLITRLTSNVLIISSDKTSEC